jgi:hypothetical protein
MWGHGRYVDPLLPHAHVVLIDILRVDEARMRKWLRRSVV